MMISTKGRYALRVMTDLAQHADEGFISLKLISERQEVSLKYLELIVSMLNKGGLVLSSRGKEGGYELSKPASEISVGEIIKLTEGSVAPVSCLECEDNKCERADKCLSLPMWQELDKIIDNYLSGITIQDLVDGKINREEK